MVLELDIGTDIGTTGCRFSSSVLLELQFLSFPLPSLAVAVAPRVPLGRIYHDSQRKETKGVIPPQDPTPNRVLAPHRANPASQSQPNQPSQSQPSQPS